MPDGPHSLCANQASSVAGCPVGKSATTLPVFRSQQTSVCSMPPVEMLAHRSTARCEQSALNATPESEPAILKQSVVAALTAARANLERVTGRVTATYSNCHKKLDDIERALSGVIE